MRITWGYKRSIYYYYYYLLSIVTPGRKQSRGGLLRRHPVPSSPAAREQHNHSFRNRHRSRPDSLFGKVLSSQMMN